MPKCWCPSCDDILPAGMLSYTGTVVCSRCGTAFSLVELQETAYYRGFKDGSAEVLAAIKCNRGPRGRTSTASTR